MRKIKNYLFLLVSCAIFSGIVLCRIRDAAETAGLTDEIIYSDGFRSMNLEENIIREVQSSDAPGEILGIYMLETDFGDKKGKSLQQTADKKYRWECRPAWDRYINACRAVWDDVKYFPVAEASNRKDTEVSFVNSWMYGRNYGGSRVHEGTDIMPSVVERDLYPIVSMTDGTVENIGWLKLGGWRIGINAPGGAYFYYAHLSSYTDLEKGDTVKAGDILGYMGDTGYGEKEGTAGNFPVHLHLGIYLYDSEKEISVNPYPVLKYIENRKISCRFLQ